MIKNLILLIILLLLLGCSTKTLYRTPEKISLNKIGFVDLTNDSILTRICSNTNSVFRETIISTFKNIGSKNILYCIDKNNYYTPDTQAIKDICIKNNLDGIIIPKLTFIYVTTSFMFIPIDQRYDTEVGLKLFDKNGKLIFSVMFNTHSGDTYTKPPKPEIKIRDGTTGATLRLLTLIRKSRLK